MVEIGRVCMKVAGRDAGNVAVVVDILENNYVLLDGNVRRKKCNARHLEPMKHLLKLEKNAPHEEVMSALKEAGFKVLEAKKKVKKEKKAAKEAPEAKKPVKKAAKKKE